MEITNISASKGVAADEALYYVLRMNFAMAARLSRHAGGGFNLSSSYTSSTRIETTYTNGVHNISCVSQGDDHTFFLKTCELDDE